MTNVGCVMQKITCTEIWGGIHDADAEMEGNGFVASIYARAADGRRGGDIHYLSACSGEAITHFALADVRGHGESVSTISQWLYDALQEGINDLEGNDLLSGLNMLAKERGFEAMTTAAILSLRRSDSRLHLAYAGHPPVFLYRQAAGRWEAAELGSPRRCANLPLGAFGNASYDDEVRQLAAGDRLFVYTDGLIEATNSGGEAFGRAGVEAALMSTGDDTVAGIKHAVLGALDEHCDGAISQDDVTFMVVEVR